MSRLMRERLPCLAVPVVELLTFVVQDLRYRLVDRDLISFRCARRSLAALGVKKFRIRSAGAIISGFCTRISNTLTTQLSSNTRATLFFHTKRIMYHDHGTTLFTIK